MYLMMAVIGVAFAPLSAVSHRFACFTVQTYCRWVRWTAGWMIGLKSEIRGPVPTDGVLIASKHQSFFELTHTKPIFFLLYGIIYTVTTMLYI